LVAETGQQVGMARYRYLGCRTEWARVDLVSAGPEPGPEEEGAMAEEAIQLAKGPEVVRE